MKLLIIGNDTKIFTEGSAVRNRTLQYASDFAQYRVIVASTHSRHKSQFGIGEKGNVDLVSVYARNKIILFIKTLFTAYRVGKNMDVISGQDPFELGLIALLVSIFRRVRLHIQIHTPVSVTFFTRMIISRADRIRVVSVEIEQCIAPFANCGIDVLPVYIDKSIFQNASPDERLRTIVPNTDFLILAMSRIEPEKNIETIIHIVGELEKNHPNVTLIVVGDGTRKAALQELVRVSGYHRIVFLPRTNTPERYYKAVDLFINLSRFEGYGMTIVESMLAGTPVLTTDVGIASQYIKNGYNSWIVEQVQEPAHVLREILKNHSQYIDVRTKLAATSFDLLPDMVTYKKMLRDSFFAAIQ